MRVEISETLITELAKAVAHGDDGTQSLLLNVFGKELAVSCRGKDEMQICYISDKLNNDGKKLIKELAEFIELRETEQA